MILLTARQSSKCFSTERGGAGWRLRALAVIAGLAVGLASVRAQSNWVGGEGNYDDDANWSGGFVPDGDDPVVIANGGTARASGNNGAESVSLGGSGPGASGTLEVLPGITSQFSVFNSFYAGQSGLGTLTIGSQALVATGDFYAGYGAGVTGIVNANGGFLSPFRVYFGYAGNATVTFEHGSTLESTTGYVGFLAGSEGVVTLRNSTWKAEEQSVPRDITVGVGGRGEIDATGSEISAANLVLGSAAGSSGEVTASGGKITVQNSLEVGSAGTGIVTLTNAVDLTSDGISLGSGSDATGSLSSAGGTVISTGDVLVGVQGEGILGTNGARFEAPELFVAREAGSTGTATFSGGTIAISKEIHVGAGGTGTVTLEGGGELYTDKGNMGFATGATGTINVLDGTWLNTQAIFVGVSGHGTLNIGANGAIESESGYVGQDASGEGTVNVAGGSWTMGDTFAIGVNGTGEFSASAGGEVSAAWSQVGLHAGSSGVVTVDNATWTTTQTLTIGVAGGGEVVVKNGATVSAGSVELAASSGVTGSLTVTDSTLTTENVLAGPGTASASFSGAQLKLLGGSEVLDTLLINGFAPGAVTLGAGGLTVDTQGGNAQITSSLAGPGMLTKTGVGRLRLTTTNTFSGGTTAAGGALEIASPTALGAGGATVAGGEIRAIADVTLSNATPGSPAFVAVGANATGTLSATAGNTFTIAAPEVTVGTGADVRFGSAGNTGTVVFAPDALTLAPNVAQVVVQAGTLAAGNGRLEQLTAAAGSTTIAAGATLDFQDQLSGAGIGALYGAGTINTGTLGTTNLTVNSGNFSGNIAGSGGLVKASDGTLVIAGPTAFIGGTTVNAGTLLVNGSLSFGLGEAQVNSGGTLGGTGLVGPIVLNGGTVAPGVTAGTLTSEYVWWQSGGMRFDLGPNPAGSDLLATGTLTGLGTTYAFTFVDRGWVENSTYTLITFDETNIAIDAFRYTNGGGFAGTFSYQGDALQFTLTSVPEPGAWAIMGLAGALACLLRVRSRWSRPRAAA